MSKLQPVRGTKDLFGNDEYYLHKEIVDIAEYCASRYNFEGISTPIFESTDVFKRTLGETSDVVNKEMYTFDSKGGESLTLRPEFTAGVVRAFISNGMLQNLPLKLFSTGPLFRYERPQKGRQRQFHQINFEWLGAVGAECEVQLISLADLILNDLGIDKYTLELNSLGDDESRESYRNALVNYLDKYKDDLSEDSKKRLELNPLRILDSKDKGDKKIVENAPKTIDYLSDYSKDFFENVKSGLDNLDISYVVNPKIVRGLDYYNDTVFEFISNDEESGAQSTILAGGRYDRLVKQMGGGDVPAVGFAAGVERLAILSDIQIDDRGIIAIIPESDNEKQAAVRIATYLRNEAGEFVELFLSGNFNKKMKKANANNSDVIIVLRGDGKIEIKSDIEERKLEIEDLIGKNH